MTASPVISAPAAADGITVLHDTAIDAWSALSERDQFCIINFDAGIEKMIISIQLDSTELETADNVVWLMPLPAAPEQVSLRLMSIVPRLEGELFSSAVAHKVVDCPMWYYSYSTQLYLLPFIGTTTLFTVGYRSSTGIDQGVETYGSVVGYGMTSEVISTNSSEALVQYLALKNLSLPASSKAILDDYVGTDFSLVASWISDIPEFRSKSMKTTIGGRLTYAAGIAVQFPVERIFFPLKLTGAYGDLEVPITVQVLGQVSPADYPSGNGVKVTWKHRIVDRIEPVGRNAILHDPKYFMFRDALDFGQIREDFWYFFEEQAPPPPAWSYFLSDVSYTELRIEGPASGLTEDLWLSDRAPASVSAVATFGAYPWLGPVATLIAASFLSGLLATLLVFRAHPVSIKKFAALGFLNILTLLGLYLGYIFLIEREARGDQRDFLRKSCAKYVWTFSFLFLTITASVHLSIMCLM